MLSFKVNGSCMMATYQTSTMVIIHYPKIYKLETPLERAQVDKLSVGRNDKLHVYMKDKSELVLKPMSRTETKAYHADHKLKLRALQKKHAKKAQKYAKVIQAAAKKLIEVQNDLEDEAVAIAGESYKNFHVISYELHGTNDEQVECDGFVTAPDFVSVEKMADELVKVLDPVISAAVPLPLVRERVESDSDSE